MSKEHGYTWCKSWSVNKKEQESPTCHLQHTTVKVIMDWLASENRLVSS